jgi:hypothetical protein
MRSEKEEKYNREREGRETEVVTCQLGLNDHHNITQPSPLTFLQSSCHSMPSFMIYIYSNVIMQ